MSEESEQLINTEAQAAVKNLKKLVASKGGLLGNFYFAGNTKGTEAGLIVTLTKKDKKGTRAATQGKALRKAIPGAKFCRGTVQLVKGKLRFEMYSGNASASHLKSGFKKAFVSKDLSPLKALLKKAVLAKPNSSEDAEAVDEDETIDEDAISSARDEFDPDELDDIDDVKQEQGDIAERNQELLKSFLSLKEAEEEFQESLNETRRELEELSKTKPEPTEKLQELRYALAEKLYTGDDPFPEIGEEVSSDIAQLLKATEVNLTEAVSTFSEKAWSQVVASYQEALKAATTQLGSLKKALLSDGDPDLVPIASSGLDDILSRHEAGLKKALSDVEGADSDTRPELLGTAAKLAGAFSDYLDSNKQIAVVDDNPFGVTVSIKTTLQPTLTQLASAAA